MARAWLAVIFVGLAPGAVVATFLRMPLRSLRTLAALPVFSLALVFVLGEIFTLAHVPFSATTVSITVIVLAAIAIAVARRRADRGTPDLDDREVARPLERQIACALLIAGMAVGLLTWFHGMGAHNRVPPGSDGAQHGFFVARIIASHSLNVSKIVATDPNGSHPGISFYPLAMHASAAVADRLFRADIGHVLVATTVLYATVFLPLGMYVLARSLIPKSPLVAGFTALAVPALAVFPYGPLQFGDIANVVGMSMAPIAIVLVARSVMGGERSLRTRAPAAIAAALALVTTVAVHSSQLPVVIVMVGLPALERAIREHSVHALSRAITGGLAVCALAAVLLAPTLGSVGGGVSERLDFDNTRLQSLHGVITPILTLNSLAFVHPERQTFLALLAGAGALILLFRRRFAWVLGYLMVVVLMLLAATSNSALSRALTVPWLRGAKRIGWNRAIFIPFFAGVALAFAVAGVMRLIKSGRNPTIAVSLAAVVAFGGAIGYRGYHTSSAMVRYSFVHDALLTSDSAAAFEWLQQHAGPDDTVVNDVRLDITTDGGLWMYAQNGLHPLFGFGNAPNTGFSPPDKATVRDLNARNLLLRNLGAIDRNPRIDALARRYRARWVYFSVPVFTGFRHTLTLAGLRSNPRLQLTFHRGTAYVFKLRA